MEDQLELVPEEQEVLPEEQEELPQQAPPPKRGRPPGAVNKVRKEQGVYEALMARLNQLEEAVQNPYIPEPPPPPPKLRRERRAPAQQEIEPPPPPPKKKRVTRIREEPVQRINQPEPVRVQQSPRSARAHIWEALAQLETDRMVQRREVFKGFLP